MQHPHHTYPLVYRRRIRRRIRVAILAVRFMTRSALVARRRQRLSMDQEWIMRSQVTVRHVDDVRRTLTSFGVDVSADDVSSMTGAAPYRPAKVRETIRWFHNQRASPVTPVRRARPQSAGVVSPVVELLRRRLVLDEKAAKKAKECTDNAWMRNHYAGRVYQVNSSTWWKCLLV